LADSLVTSVPLRRKRRFRLHGYPLEEVADPEQLRVLRQAAERQEAEADRISAAIFERLRSEIPAYAAIQDPELIRDVQAVSASIVTIWLRAIKTGEIDDDELSPIHQGFPGRDPRHVERASALPGMAEPRAGPPPGGPRRMGAGLHRCDDH